jgi:acyl-CoA dehydrogenase
VNAADPRPADREAVAAVRAVAERHAAAADLDARFPVEALTALRDTGLLGLLVPTEHGGAGGSLTDLVDTTMELGRADMSVAMIFAMHCQQVAALARYGGEQLCAEVLPEVAKGALYLASVTTEPGSGGALLSSNSPAVRRGEAVYVDRQAPIVTGGRHADGFLITMRSPDATTPGQVDLVFARRDQLGAEVLGPWRALGMRATESVPMRLTGEVPAWQVVGPPGAFRAIATAVFAPLAHVGWAAAWLGAAAGALSRAVKHLRGGTTPAGELGRARLAVARERVEVVHALLRHTVATLESTADVTAAPVQSLVNTLKVRASTECYLAVDELVDLVGLRHGYLTGSELWLERALRDLRSASLNYANDRLRLANGSLALMDSGVRLG